jgi:hypothetical protein
VSTRPCASPRVGDDFESQFTACDRRTRRRIDLGYYDGGFGDWQLDHFTVGGRFLAYREYYRDYRQAGTSHFIDVYDLRRRNPQPDFYDLALGSTLVDLDLARDGRVAYLVDVPVADGATQREVYGGAARVDSGDPAQISSLTLDRGRVTWSHGGVKRSGPLR